MTVFIADIASYQQGVTIAELKAAGYSAVVIKCTEDGGYVNPYFAGWVAEALAMNFPVASFHFVHQGNYDAQAANIHRVDPPPVPVWLDCEAGATRDDGYAIADRLRALGQTVAGIYFGAQPKPGYGGWWRAAYLSNPPGSITGVYAANGGDKGSPWVGEDLWQFGSRVTIPGHADLDASAYRGTLDQLLAHGWFQHRSIDPITIFKGDGMYLADVNMGGNVHRLYLAWGGPAGVLYQRLDGTPAETPMRGSGMQVLTFGNASDFIAFSHVTAFNPTPAVTVDVAALTTALAAPLAAAVAADLPGSPAGTLTAAQVETIVETGVRTVLHGA